jgi:hypothetical protein
MLGGRRHIRGLLMGALDSTQAREAKKYQPGEYPKQERRPSQDVDLALLLA